MAKTLMYRLFGVGKLPPAMRPILEDEGIVLVDEGIPASVTFRRFRGGGRYAFYRRSWFTASIVLTKIRFAAFSGTMPRINVPLEPEALAKLDCSLASAGKLRVGFEAGDFHEGWQGAMELRFSTPDAVRFLEELARRA